jgi:hypothetical protein
MSTPLHDADFYSWTHEQAALLRERRLDELDAEHLIEASWFSAVQKAVKETPLEEDAFPEVCPFTLDEVLAAAFWPDAPAPSGRRDADGPR